MHRLVFEVVDNTAELAYVGMCVFVFKVFGRVGRTQIIRDIQYGMLGRCSGHSVVVSPVARHGYNHIGNIDHFPA